MISAAEEKPRLWENATEAERLATELGIIVDLLNQRTIHLVVSDGLPLHELNAVQWLVARLADTHERLEKAVGDLYCTARAERKAVS